MEPAEDRSAPPAETSPASFLRDFSFARLEASFPHAAEKLGVRTGTETAQAVSAQDLSTASRNAIIVSKRQRGNPVLAHIRNVRWVFGDIVPDYLVGASACALFLSLRYHLLHPDYIFVRIRELQKTFRLRVLLCHVDLDDVIKPLHDITKTAMLHECTLLCAWSVEECARYLETLKSYENKPAGNIQERVDSDYVSRVAGALTSIRHVNKTDSLTLCQSFGTLAGVVGAPMEELVRCPGIGEKKVRRLYETFHEPLRRRAGKAPRLEPPEIASQSEGGRQAGTVETAEDGLHLLGGGRGEPGAEPEDGGQGHGQQDRENHARLAAEESGEGNLFPEGEGRQRERVGRDDGNPKGLSDVQGRGEVGSISLSLAEALGLAPR